MLIKAKAAVARLSAQASYTVSTSPDFSDSVRLTDLGNPPDARTGGLQSAAGSLRRFQRELLCSAFFLLSRSWLHSCGFSWGRLLCAYVHMYVE